MSRTYIHPGGPAHTPEEEARYFPVSPSVILPRFQGEFGIYLRQNNQYVLYTSQGQSLTQKQRSNLLLMGVQAIYIKEREKKDYDEYLWKNLGRLLDDEHISTKQRSAIWYQGSVSLVQNVFEEKLPSPLNKTAYNNILKMVKNSILYFKKEGVIKEIMKLVSKGFKDYQHAVGTMCLTMFLLQTYTKDVDDELLLRCCIGAMLHDIGKCRLPEPLLSRNPDVLMDEDLQAFQSHPNLGAGLCVELNLNVETFHCILFHHELDSGEGFPSGLSADSIPWYVKVLRLCNVYDNYTRPTPWRRADRPFDALQRIKNRKHFFGEEYIKRLILILGNAEVIESEEGLNSKKKIKNFYDSL